MNVQIAVFPVLLLLSLGIFLAVAILKFMAATGNAVLGRDNTRDNFGTFVGSFMKVVLIGGLLVLVGGGLFLKRSHVSVATRVASTDTHDHLSVELRDGTIEIRQQVDNDLRQGLQELERAREEIRDAVRTSGFIDMGTASDDAADASSSQTESSAAQNATDAGSGQDDTTASAAQETPSDNESASDTGDLPAELPLSSLADGNTESSSPLTNGTTERGDESGLTEPPNAGSGEIAAAGASQSGNVVVFQLSSDSVERLLGANGQQWLNDFRDKLPKELRDSYALIPLTATVGTTAPAAARPFATADRIQSALAALASMMADAQVTVDQLDEIASEGAIAESNGESADRATSQGLLTPSKPPSWLTNSAADQLVVETGFSGESQDLTGELNAAVSDALVAHLQGVVADDIDYSSNWRRLVSLRLSNDAVQQCVVDSYDLIEVLPTGYGREVMRKKFVLVEFPPAVQQAALTELRAATQRQRTTILGIAVGVCWVSLVIATVGFRVGRRSSRIARYLVAPVCILAATVTGAAGIGMVGASATGELVVSTPLDEMHEVVVQLGGRD